MTKIVTLRLGNDVYEELRDAAVAKRRTLSSFIEAAALAWIREGQYVDDEEMIEILNDDALLRRLTTGSQQARRHKGEIVDYGRASADRCVLVPREHVPEPPDLGS